jgi:hypothetical protein
MHVQAKASQEQMARLLSDRGEAQNPRSLRQAPTARWRAARRRAVGERRRINLSVPWRIQLKPPPNPSLWIVGPWR